MATRKKKVVHEEDNFPPGDIPVMTDAKSVMQKRKKQESVTWPKVVKGSHLTVKTFENGRTELEWDDDALLRDVRNAILKHESTVPVKKVTKTSKKKNV